MQKISRSVQMSNHNILIVEDDDSVRNMMNKIIAKLFHNISVTCVRNGEEAIREINNNYDLIFLDINLTTGKINGVETLEKIKGIKPEQNVYMMTGYPVGYDDEKIIKENALGILEKPFEFEKLSDIIDNIISK